MCKSKCTTINLYRHFNDKYDLLNHVVGTLIDHFRELYLPDINPDNPRQFFEKLMRDVLTFIHDNKDIVRSVITLNFTAKFILFL